MRASSIAWRCLVGAVLACWALIAAAQVAVPKLSARVTDLTATLSAEQRQTLEARLAQFEASKGAQIAVLLVPTTQPEAIEQYARRVLDEWKLGRKGVDDGALLLVAMKDRKLRIEVQYGLEGVLPDATAKRIIDETVVPRFKQQDFYGGISAGIERMMSVVSGEALPAPAVRSAERTQGSDVDGGKIESLLVLGFGLVFVVGAILRSVFGRFAGSLAAGGIGGVAAWFIVGSLVAAGIVALIVFFLTGVIGLAGTNSMRRGGWSGGSWGGSSWGGGGGGWSGGGGGWSGGGGSGGGGGASGSW